MPAVAKSERPPRYNKFRMRILADSKIPMVKDAFSNLGEVEIFNTADLAPELVRGARVLLVRSETMVDEGLLGGSLVEFVGTATIGVDHVDQHYLQGRGIGFAAAPGSNARSVAEYVVAALLELSVERGQTLRDQTLGVVGLGNIGSLVAAAAQTFGMEVLPNDPPRARAEPAVQFAPLREVLRADFVTLHVPLTRSGPDRTYHLLDRERLRWMAPEAILINTSRGAVVDNDALRRALKASNLGGAVLDVWEGEPEIDAGLLRSAELATPHIAGYSWDGKIRGTLMLHRACCRHFGRVSTWVPPNGPDESAAIDLPPGPDPLESRLLPLVRRSYSIRRDDRRLRRMLRLPPDARGRYFRKLRREYPVRREFSSVCVRTESPADSEVATRLGFQVEGDGQEEFG